MLFRSMLRTAVVALVVSGGALVAAPAHAAGELVSCDDGGSPDGVVGGNNPGSDCAGQVALYGSLGCTVGYADTPDGPVDTLTVDCSAGTAQNEYDSPGNSPVSPTPRRGSGNKSNPPVVRQVQASFSCTSFSQGVGTAAFHIDRSQDQCVASLTSQANAWGDRIFDIAATGGRFTDVRSTTRCNEANLVNHVREFGPAFAIVTTAGDVDCTTVVYGNRVGG
jgi:hypothetical protein